MGLKIILFCYTIYILGIGVFLAIIADPFTMSTYFSENSLMPGLANREFSLGNEAEYYYKDLSKLLKQSPEAKSLRQSPAIINFINNELESFGLEVHKQNFQYSSNDHQFTNGTNLYTIIRGERSTSSEAIALCIPYRVDKDDDTLTGVGLGMALAKYFSTKSYWAKDVIIMFIDRDQMGASAWLDSYYDIKFIQNKNNHEQNSNILGQKLIYDSLPDRSGPLQAAIVLELYGLEFSRINVKIQGMFGQLPNLDLFNLVIEIAARESVTPFFEDKSLPFDLDQQELYMHHLETAMSFMKKQATMQSDGLHGHFLRFAVQALTIEAPKYLKGVNGQLFAMTSSCLNMGRLIEGLFRSLNNLTERFNRSYYFYIILSLRRFTSIGYYMIAMGIMIVPILLKALHLHKEGLKQNKWIRARTILLLSSALILSILSTFNISSAFISSVVAVPLLILI